MMEEVMGRMFERSSGSLWKTGGEINLKHLSHGRKSGWDDDGSWSLGWIPKEGNPTEFWLIGRRWKS